MTRGVPGKVLRSKTKRPSRRQEYSASTKRALVDVATDLFTEQGYAGTSLDQIVAGARVTKGALYHHFGGKQALFESVFEAVENDASRSIRKAVRDSADPWDKATSGLRAFLGVVQQPAYRRIIIQEGPAVLGHERYREQEERSTFGIVQDIVASVLATYDLEPSMVETFSRIFFGAMSAAGASVSSADDPEQASAEVEAAIAFILAGLRQQAESGGDLGVSAQAAAPADGRARGHSGGGSPAGGRPAGGSPAGGQAPPAHLE
jgi:AcrR family transcriptional regulator